MLAYSGRGRFLVQPLVLSTVVEEIGHLLEAVISKKAVLKFDFVGDLPRIEGDVTQVRQVVMNLITNASEAIDDQVGSITLTTGVMEADRAFLSQAYFGDGLAEGRCAFLQVRDTGCGMDEQVRAKLFDPFFSTKFAGRGLGLAAVLGIVQSHHGAIQIDSQVGEGTTFQVLFPCSRPGAADPP
ncbi:MAG: ATP-binding protein, partial [Phycisphaerae bacterium]|nr:ATP-binding protein [Phycisphaerae bacterium]